jgi:hypothetical protein
MRKGFQIISAFSLALAVAFVFSMNPVFADQKKKGAGKGGLTYTKAL